MRYILQQDTVDAKQGDLYSLQNNVYIHQDVVNNPSLIKVSYPQLLVESSPDFFLPETKMIITITVNTDNYTFIANTDETFIKTKAEVYNLIKSL